MNVLLMKFNLGIPQAATTMNTVFASINAII